MAWKGEKMSLLITPTLLDSYDWLMKAPETTKKGTSITWKEDALNQLEATLTRAPFRPNKAIIKGMEFERLACAKSKVNDIDTLKASDNFKKVCRLIKGGDFQVKTKKFVVIDGAEYVLFNRLDVKFPKLIQDIKTTANYRGQASYLSKWQHKFYTLVDEIRDFQYIVAEWKGADIDDFTIKAIHVINYYAEDFEAIEKEIVGHIKLFMEFLEGNEKLKEAYLHTYNRF